MREVPHRVLPSLMYDLPHYAGHHSYITRTAILFIIGLLVSLPIIIIMKENAWLVMLFIGTACLLAESHWEGGSADLFQTRLQGQSQ